MGLNAQAASTVTLSEQLTGWSPNPGGGWVRNAYNPRVIDAATAANRSWAAAGAGASARVIATDVSTIAGRAGPLAVSSAMSVSIGEAAGAVGRCLSGGVPICAAASAAAAVYAAYRVYASPDGLTFDPGVAPSVASVPFYRTGGYTQTEDATLQGSCDKYAALIGKPYHQLDQVGNTLYCKAADNASAYAQNLWVPGAVFLIGNRDVLSCVASIDPTNPAYNVPAGSPVGPDGKCPTARYNHGPISAANAAAKVTVNPPANADGWVQPTKDAIGTGGQSVPAGITTTGPGSQTGSPTTTTTTGPSGTTTTTSTPTYTYNYAGDTINYTTNTTTVVNNGGNITTTTTNNPAPTPQDPEDPCTVNPERVGCQRIGDAPTDHVPKANRDLTYSAESVTLPSGCPGPITFVAGNRIRTISYDPACDAAISMAPYVKALGALSAMLVVVTALRAT